MLVTTITSTDFLAACETQVTSDETTDLVHRAQSAHQRQQLLVAQGLSRETAALIPAPGAVQLSLLYDYRGSVSDGSAKQAAQNERAYHRASSQKFQRVKRAIPVSSTNPTDQHEFVRK